MFLSSKLTISRILSGVQLRVSCKARRVSTLNVSLLVLMQEGVIAMVPAGGMW